MRAVQSSIAGTEQLACLQRRQVMSVQHGTRRALSRFPRHRAAESSRMLLIFDSSARSSSGRHAIASMCCMDMRHVRSMTEDAHPGIYGCASDSTCALDWIDVGSDGEAVLAVELCSQLARLATIARSPQGCRRACRRPSAIGARVPSSGSLRARRRVRSG